MKNIFYKFGFGFCSVVIAANAVLAAERFTVDKQPLGYIAPLSLSNSDVSSGNTKAYQPWFEPGSWQGDIIEYAVANNGALSTRVDLSGVSPIYRGNTPATWSASVQMNDADVASGAYWNTGREIVTYNGNAQVPFRWASLTDDDKQALDPAAIDKTTSSILDFVRGDRTNENARGGTLRSRTRILGDFLHSNVVYVGSPNERRVDNNYPAWASASARANRAPRVYAGSNDGMLHAFDAATGDEVYAYVPSMLIGKLDELSKRPYAHTYFVDGKLTARDAYFGGTWHTVLMGTLGAGGRGPGR